MMHHPNMHHQAMSGHPAQHMPAHQAMPAHHQMPPHQMHRENRHVTLTRVPLGPSQPAGGMGSHGQAMGGMGAMGVPPPHHAPAQRPPHAIRAMPHHPPQQHHSVPPQQMKPMRRPYYAGAGPAPVPPYGPPIPTQPQPQHTVVSIPASAPVAVTSAAGAEAGAGKASEAEVEAAGDPEAARPQPAANSKEKTPMCLVNELARYNKIKHQYRLTSETGPAHKKVFTVTLRLGDTEEYTAEGSSIKRAQHAAAGAALSGTAFPPPPPRAQPPHAAAHAQRHAGTVMPTVELNALAMKLCQPAVYTSIPPVPAARLPRVRPPYRLPFHPAQYQRLVPPGLLYRVRVSVGEKSWLGEGGTPQAARHDAAARALAELRAGTPGTNASAGAAEATPDFNGETQSAAELLSSEVKSPVSLVHELALKRNLSVQFSVKSERGPPHMRVFITTCTVGELETEGEGNGKKVSKRRAAEHMLSEMRRRWPPALLRARPPHERRRAPPNKKKPRNLIKEGTVSSAETSGGADNPISRLAVACHAARARSPQYRVLEERGAARRREFVVQCDAPPHRATGLGPNKKTAKRRAAHNVLLAMEVTTKPGGENGTSSPEPAASADSAGTDAKRKEGSTSPPGGAGDVRQPVPGVLMMDYHQRSAHPPVPNGVSETSATASSGGNTPGAKDQLLYLSQLLGFTVQFSDFPKRNHGEYLSLVSLSTSPPVMCHGGGASTAHSHEQCARAALRALALMGLDTMQSIPSPGKTATVGNGIPE